MEHYVAYHNAERYGSLEDDGEFNARTNKKWPKNSVQGSVIWMMSCEEQSKKYFLAYVFKADSFEPATDNSDFKFVATGAKGHFFKNPVVLNGLKWFQGFLKHMGNFGVGFQKITGTPYVDELMKLAKKDGFESP